MNGLEPHGGRLSGASPRSEALYQSALTDFVSWRLGAAQRVERAVAESPDFVMARVLQACMCVGSRDPRRVRAATPHLAALRALPANEQEQRHVAALSRVLADDYEGATRILGDALVAQPRDLLALAMAHGLDYLMGHTAQLRDRASRVLPAWPSDLPGYHSVLAMQAFGLVECGDYDQAEDAALAALALDENDARAHHAMAHVFEMTDRPEAGAHWLRTHAAHWSVATAIDTHGWWHLCLFLLAQEKSADVLALYDARIRTDCSHEVGDLIDATALLWRLRLLGVDVGPRWNELSGAWEPHIDDGFCSFSDLHAMLAFAGAHHWERADRLARSVGRAQSAPTRYGLTTRQLGLPGCLGLLAHGRGDHARAIALLGRLPYRVHRLGGSHAQRDVLHLTLLHAIDSIRRPRGPASGPKNLPATHEARTGAARHIAATSAP